MSKKKPTENPPPPLCVFCSAPWTDDMVKVLAASEVELGYYEGDIDGVETKINIDGRRYTWHTQVTSSKVAKLRAAYGDSGFRGR